MHRIVILGGGTAGTLVANRLRSQYARGELEITVVDADDEHHYQPGYLFLPFGMLRPEQIVRSRHRFLPDGVRLVLSAIQQVDPAARRVLLADGSELDYDTLVIATGVQPRPEATPGGDGPEAGVSVHHFYDLPSAVALTDAMRNLRGGRIVVHISEMPIKCPVAPLEFTFLADGWLRDKNVRHRYEIVYVTPLDGAFTKPVASRELADALQRRDIALETDFAIAEIDNDAREIVSFDGRRIGFDLLVTVPVNMGAEYIATSGLGNELNLVPCDQGTMQSLEHPEIFVLGDAGTLQTSKAGSVAHFSVDVFCENFDAHLAGEPLPHAFDGHANCFIESGGGKGMLLDFNYETQPYTGVFPLPVVGPMSLLKETRLNHWAKVAFRWVYWNMLIVGRPLPFTTNMSRIGKVIEDADRGGRPRPRLGGPLAGLRATMGTRSRAAARAGSGAPAAPGTPTSSGPWDASPAGSPAPAVPAVRSTPKPRPAAAARPAPTRPAAARPAQAPAARPRATASGAGAPTATLGTYVDRPGVDSTADPATVLPDPIIPKF